MSGGVPRRSLRVALVVGVVLNAINQGGTVFRGRAPVYWKVALTFVVPYLVATYGAVSSRMAAPAAAPCSRCGAAAPGDGGGRAGAQPPGLV